MAEFTPVITSLNALEVVRLNRCISIFLVISNLFIRSRALPEPHNSIRPALLRPLSTVLSARRPTRSWLKTKALRPNRLERPEVTAVADVEIRSSDRWQGEPRRRWSVFRYGGGKNDTSPDHWAPVDLGFFVAAP